MEVGNGDAVHKDDQAAEVTLDALPVVTWQPLPWPPNLIQFGDLQGNSKWSSGILGADGETIFCLPSDSESVLAFNTRTRDTQLFGRFPQMSKWSGAVLAADKRTVLVIDPASQSIDYFGDFPPGESKWSGGVLGPDNITIFAIPLNSETVLAINTQDRTTKTFGSLPGMRKWRGGVLGPDNETIFAMPSNSDQVLAINTTEYTVQTFGFAGHTSWKWSCGVLGFDRSTIFGVPLNSPTILAIEVGELVSGDAGLICNTKETEGSVSSECILRSFAKESVKRASVTRRESLMKHRTSLPDLHHYHRSSAGPEDFKSHRISVSVGSRQSRLPNIDEGLMIDKKTRRFSQPVHRLPPTVEQHLSRASISGIPHSDAQVQPWRPPSATTALPMNRRHTTLGTVAHGAHRSGHRSSLQGSASESRLGGNHRFSQLL